MHIRTLATAILLAAAAHAAARAAARDTTAVQAHKQDRPSFSQTLSKAIGWIRHSWTDYDPRYAVPSFYDATIQLQNTMSCEWLDFDIDGVRLDMRSKVSNKTGLMFKYKFLSYGFAIDLNAASGNKRKNEFTLTLNSNLASIDIIRRRTGGDFIVRQLDIEGVGDKLPHLDDISRQYAVGDDVRYDITGLNVNIFTNHRRYSNPAAFSNGAIQLRTAGSPVIGIGYTHQKLRNGISDTFIDYAARRKGYDGFDGTPEQMTDLFVNDKGTLNVVAGAIGQSTIPSYITIDDYHLQLGYALNIAFSRRLLLGTSLILSPGIKSLTTNNSDTYQYRFRNEICETLNPYLPGIQQLIRDGEIEIQSPEYRSHILSLTQLTPDLFTVNTKHTSVGANAYARASLRYNHNRWRFGVNANACAYLYDRNDVSIRNRYGSIVAYAGYCFGRKKIYRHDGTLRQAYINTALTPAQIQEMRDTMPAGNITHDTPSARRTAYHTDRLSLSIHGCDLVKGPDGQYGHYRLADGHVTAGGDSDGLLTAGTSLPVSHDGTITLRAGHKPGFRTANWWKSNLKGRQNTMNRFPDLLHYALCGKLTLYLRSRDFGTSQPVALTIDSLYLCHGREAESFFQLAAAGFRSRSTASIMGRAGVNGRMTRVYIESDSRGKHFHIYVTPLRASMSRWMQHINDRRIIGRLSIPGTHDAGSASLPESPVTGTAQTQNMPVAEQLLDGIRAFDIRLKQDMRFGHTMTCREGLKETLRDIDSFLTRNPSEFVVLIIGSDESGARWEKQMADSLKNILWPYRHRIAEQFSAVTPLQQARGKILVIRRQEDCPVGKLLRFTDNAVFTDNGFRVEDIYREHKTYRKAKIVAQHLREAYENDDPTLWYITFNTIAWDPRHHRPYNTAWGAKNIRKPMNPALRETIEQKQYTQLGIIFLDFYNDHGDKPQLVNSIINSNYTPEQQTDYIPYNP